MVQPWIVETTPHEELSFYTRANIGEVFPDPVSPLAFSWFEYGGTIGGAEIGFRNAYYRIGVMTPDELPPDKAVFLGVTNGYGYLNAAALRLLGHRAPGMTPRRSAARSSGCSRLRTCPRLPSIRKWSIDFGRTGLN